MLSQRLTPEALEGLLQMCEVPQFQKQKTAAMLQAQCLPFANE